MGLLLEKKGMLIAAIAFFSIFIFSSTVPAKDILQGDPREISWHISALSVTFDKKRSLYIAEDDVVITGGKTRLEADYVEFSNQTKEAFAQGHVLLISGEDSISCNAMRINLEDETGTINKGTIYIQKNNFYISGENIRKTGKFTYDADSGSITSCDGDVPDWKITGKNLNVTIEGYGTAKHTVLWAKKVPVFYTPFLIFPVQTKRQSGLLIPRITSSDRKGFEYEQPLYLALSRSTDATLYADYMGERGIKGAGEFRYVLDNRSKGAVFFDYLEDDKVDDGTPATEQYAFSSTPVRSNKDRWWLRMKHDQRLENGFSMKVDLDVVSDPDYLQEFHDGFTGFTETNLYFEDEFGRSLDEYDDDIRKNRINFSKTWDNYAFNAQALWYDNVRARRENTADTTLQTLPAFEFDVSKNPILNSGFYYTFDSEYRSFYRKDTTTTLVNGQRLDLYPTLYKPFKIGQLFHFEPFIGVRQTVWHTSDFTDINGNTDDFHTRETFRTGAELSTKLVRVYQTGSKFADKVKHELVPKLEYAFSPYISQDDLPSFDDLDRLEEENILTWSLTNYFIKKNIWETVNGEKRSSYNEFAYLKLYQSYDIKKERDDESEPFSDIHLELELSPTGNFSLNTDLAWSPYDYHFNELNTSASVSDNRGDSLTAEYRYTIDTNESARLRADIQITHGLSTYFSIEQNLETNRTVETQVGMAYEKPCWTFDLLLSEARGDNAVTFLITLHGIGGFGTR